MFNVNSAAMRIGGLNFKTMARPKGTKYIETPEKMWELFQQYLTDLKNRPFIVTDWVGGMGKQVERKKERPVTMEGFREFGYRNGLTIKNYFDNIENKYDDYYTICLRIKDYIRQEQIEGGMAGIYNPSITQRLNNLVERTENKHEVNEIIVKREG